MSIDEIVRIFLKSQSLYIGGELRIKASGNMKKYKGNMTKYEGNMKKYKQNMKKI